MIHEFSSRTMPRLITKFDAELLPFFQLAILEHPELPIYLDGMSLWTRKEVDASPFWNTYERINRYMAVVVNYTDNGASFSDVLNWKAEGKVKQETVYVPVFPNEKTEDITSAANGIFSAAYGEGAFKPEYWFGVVKKGDDLFPRIDAKILLRDLTGPLPKTDLRARFAAASKKPRHFIVWAASIGHTVSYATVSRHMAGTQGITTPWAIAYDCFFNSLSDKA